MEQQCAALSRALGRAEQGAKEVRAAMAEAATAQATDEANHEVRECECVSFCVHSATP